MRFGDRLIREQNITQEQLDEALRLQIRDGSRVGSALIKLGYLDMDAVAECLGRHYGMPATLSAHFAMAPRDLQEKLSPDQALCWGAIPVGRLTGEESPIAVAVMSPLPPEAVTELSHLLGGPVVLAVASEIQIQSHLTQVYGIPPSRRVVSFPRAATAPPDSSDEAEAEILLQLEPLAQPSSADEGHDDGARADTRRPAAAHTVEVSAETESLTVDLEDLSGLDMTVEEALATMPEVARELGLDAAPALDDAAQAKAEPESEVAAESGAELLDDNAVPTVVTDAGSALGRIAIRRGTNQPQPNTGVVERSLPDSFEDALRLLRGTMDRDRIADVTIDVMRDFLAHPFDLGAVLVARGGAAIGWKGFRRMASENWLSALTIPLRVPSSIHHSYTTGAIYIGPPPADGLDVDGRVWATLQCAPPALVATAPVPVDSQSHCLLYAHSHAPASADVVDEVSQQLEKLARATSKSFKRALRAAQR